MELYVVFDSYQIEQARQLDRYLEIRIRPI
jgi:hypothetical protein